MSVGKCPGGGGGDVLEPYRSMEATPVPGHIGKLCAIYTIFKLL